MTRLSSEALENYLLGLTLHGVKLGLHNITHLLQQAQQPQQQYPSVHVAGTNGKGSVLALLQRVLMAAGYRVGRFTSPHLVSLRERFQINGASISQGDLDEQIQFFRGIAETMTPPPTFFEMCTAIAFRYFAQARVDIALVEVGMGGRLDATNVLHPHLTAVTNIDLEHTQYLGDSIEKIAFEKAGILKEGVPAVLGEMYESARSVIEERAAALDTSCSCCGRDFSYTLAGTSFQQRISYTSAANQLQDVPLSLAGAHQGGNAALAVAMAEALQPDFPRLDSKAIVTGLAEACWPCRLERLAGFTPPVIIDVAHNAAGARQLAQAVSQAITVLAISSDKDAEGILAALRPISQKLILSQFTGKRAMAVDALGKVARTNSYDVRASLSDAIDYGLSLASEDCPLLVTGSLYTAGEARRYLTQAYQAPSPEF